MGALIKNSQRRAIGPDEVFQEACRLAEELSTTPPHQMIADNLGCSRQHVSQMFVALEYAGKIEWIARYIYRINRATLIAPPN